MYPTRLNVISKQKQAHVKRMLSLEFVQNIISILFIVLAVFSIFAIIAQLFLQSYFADVTLQSLRTQNPTRKINERVIEINSTLDTSSAIQKSYNQWSPYIVLIANTLPESATIESLRFTHSSGILELVGTTPSREDFLQLKNNFEALKQIDVVKVPLSDLTRQEEIHFSLSIPFAF